MSPLFLEVLVSRRMCYNKKEETRWVKNGGKRNEDHPGSLSLGHLSLFSSKLAQRLQPLPLPSQLSSYDLALRCQTWPLVSGNWTSPASWMSTDSWDFLPLLRIGKTRSTVLSMVFQGRVPRK